jgi:type I restriction enzyme S subunit
VTRELPIWALVRSREEFAGESDLPVLTVKSDSGVGVRDFSEGGRAVSQDLSGYRVVRVGDMVVNKMWARFGAYGVAEHEGVISPAYWVLELDHDVVAPRFIHHLVRSAPYLAEVRRLSKDLPPNGYDLPWQSFRTMRVRLPGLAEQWEIASYLDAETARIDALIANKRQLRDLLDERWRSTIDTVIDDIPGPRVPLRRFVRLITQGVSPQAGNLPYSPGERGLLKLSAVRFGDFRPAENKELDADFDSARATVPIRGDLLVTRANTPDLVGDACAVRDPDPNVVLCDLIYLLRLDRRLTAEFVAYVLISTRSRRELSSLARGTSQSMVKLRSEDVVSVRVPAPSVRVQHEAVRRLDSRRNQVKGATDRLRRQIDLISEHRQALITAAVTGEFRVPGAA